MTVIDNIESIFDSRWNRNSTRALLVISPTSLPVLPLAAVAQRGCRRSRRMKNLGVGRFFRPHHFLGLTTKVVAK
jgi:hypothetical protein